jgi:hypothetical protein
MPVPSRLFIRVSIIYLCLGALVGALLLIQRWVPLGPAVATLRASHVQMLLAGWLTQFIMGVAWWLFPPLARRVRPATSHPARRGQAQRGSEPLLWATFVCLNLGVLLRALFEPLHSWTQIGFFGALSGISGLLLLVAALTFALNLWQRVRALG